MILRTTLSNTRYKVVWCVAKNAAVFKKGPKRNQPRVFTDCNIYEINDSGEHQIGYGVTWQSWQDEHCEHMCRKVSLTRALRFSHLSKSAKTDFWREFFERYPLPEKAKPKPESASAKVLGIVAPLGSVVKKKNNEVLPEFTSHTSRALEVATEVCGTRTCGNCGNNSCPWRTEEEPEDKNEKWWRLWRRLR